MGLGGISIWQLLIVLVIVALIFGTKKLRNIGGDLGGAVKGFKSAINDKPVSDENDVDEGEAGDELNSKSESIDAENK